MKSLYFILTSLFLFVGCTTGQKDFSDTGGYEFIYHKKGTGEKPKAGDYVILNAYVEVNDTIVENSTYTIDTLIQLVQPKVAGPQNPIMELLRHVRTGDSVSCVVPVDSFPGPPPFYKGQPTANYILNVFEVRSPEKFQIIRAAQEAEMAEQMAIVSKRLPEVEATFNKTLADYKSGALKDQMVSVGTKGLEYVIIEKGTGPKKAFGEKVSTRYYGATESDGKMFDTSFKKGSDFSFTIGKSSVITGWHEAFQNLSVGDKAVVFIPSELGYGERGNPPIPGNADLVFYVEIVK